MEGVSRLGMKRFLRCRIATALIAIVMMCFVSSTIAIKPYSSFVRGGDEGRSPIELNPDWVPPPSTRSRKFIDRSDETEIWIETQAFTDAYVTMADLGNRYYGKSSLLDRFLKNCSQLHRNNPSIFLTSVSCALVCIMWRIQSLKPFLMNYFLCSRRNALSGRIPSIFLSSISHSEPMHLAVNMVSLFFFGPSVQRYLARRSWPLWPLMVGASMAGSIMFLLFGGRHGSCLGLSAVTLSLFAFEARAHPQQQLGLVIGVFPVRMAAELLLQIYLLWSAIGPLFQRSNVAHLAHLGGLLFGIGYYEVFSFRGRWPEFPQQQFAKFQRYLRQRKR